MDCHYIEEELRKHGARCQASHSFWRDLIVYSFVFEKETLNLINIFHFYLYENEGGSLKSKSDFGVVRNTNLHESEQIS